MKRIGIFTLILYLSIFVLLVSCSDDESKTTPVSTISISPTSDTTTLLQEIDKLKNENKDLTKKNKTLENRAEHLEIMLTLSDVSPLSCNYNITNLLQTIYTEKSVVDIFPGKLQSIHMETTDEGIYFIFSIDKISVNPNWDGPGSDDGKGFYLNSEEKYENYKGRLSTNFSYKGFESYEDKQEYVLNKYGNNNIYIFYMIDDKIVFVDYNPGP